MHRDFGKLVRSFFEASEDFGDVCWTPRVDIYRGSQQWLIKCDLAGVKSEDIHLQISNQEIVVEGVRRDDSLIEGRRAYSMEISYSTFRRVIQLPFDLSVAEIQREYRDGMFLIVIEPGATTS